MADLIRIPTIHNLFRLLTGTQTEALPEAHPWALWSAGGASHRLSARSGPCFPQCFPRPMGGKQTFKNLRFYWAKSALSGGRRCFRERRQNRSPHGEEPAAGRRLEPWVRATALSLAILRDGASRLLRMRAVEWARSGASRDLFKFQADALDDGGPAGDLVSDEACRLLRAR